jgi:hypothetical protein
MKEFSEWLMAKKILVPVHCFEDDVVMLAIKFGEQWDTPKWVVPHKEDKPLFPNWE